MQVGQQKNVKKKWVPTNIFNSLSLHMTIYDIHP